MIFIGIDPGKSGGIVALNDAGAITRREVMPVLATAISPAGIIGTLRACRPGMEAGMAYLEKAHAMPKQGVSSMFTYGTGFGYLEMALVCLRLPYELVMPSTWQREMFQGTDSKLEPKNRAVHAATRIMDPSFFMASERCKKPHLGLVDAYLIAEYGRRKSLGFLSRKETA
jgi:hypothetical protein